MKTAEEILKYYGISDDSFFTCGGTGFDTVESAMKKYASDAIDAYAKEAQASLGNRTLKDVAEQIKSELQ